MLQHQRHRLFRYSQNFLTFHDPFSLYFGHHGPSRKVYIQHLSTKMGKKSVSNLLIFIQNIGLYGLEALKYHLQIIGLPIVPPFHAQTPFWFDESTVLARLHRYSPKTFFLFDVDIYVDPQDLTANRIYFGHTPKASKAP